MKQTAILLALLVAGLTVRAQQKPEFHPEWMVGANAGVTMSSVAFMQKIPQATFMQESGGLVVRYISERNVGLQIELNYSMRGWKQVPDKDGQQKDRYNESVSYLEVPFLWHIYFGMGKWMRGYFNLGPQLGYCLSQKTIGESVLDDYSGENIPPYYTDPQVKNKFDYGITGGFGLELRTKIGCFNLEGRYYYGLSDLYGNSRADFFQSSHNQVIGIKLAYLIPFASFKK